MLKAALFRCFCIPLDLGDLLLDLVTVQVVECHLSGADPGHLQVADIVYLSGMVQDRRYIGSDKAFLFRGTYDHGAFLTGYKDLTRIILKHYLQRIGTTHTNQCLSQRIQRTYFVFLIVVIHQLDQHLGIRLKGIHLPFCIILSLLQLSFLPFQVQNLPSQHQKGQTATYQQTQKYI